MIMRPNSQQILAHTHTNSLQTKSTNALLTVDYVGQQSILTMEVGHQIHSVTKTVLKNPQDLFLWGSINTHNNLKGQQRPLYSASQLTLDGHQTTPMMVDLQQYKYWVLFEGEALITIGSSKHHLTAHQGILLPPMQECQLSNLQATELVFIQLQSREGFNPNQLVGFEFHR